MRLGRALTPTEETAVSLAIYEASGRPAHAPEGAGAGQARGGAREASPTIPQVWALLRDPTAEMARELRVRRDSVRAAAGDDPARSPTRSATWSAARLSGLFDGPTTVRPDFTRADPDRRPVPDRRPRRRDRRDDPGLRLVLGAGRHRRAGGPVRMIIRDELWRSLRIPALVRKIDSDLRLSRAHGTIQVLATHRLADFETAGAAGSRGGGHRAAT